VKRYNTPLKAYTYRLNVEGFIRRGSQLFPTWTYAPTGAAPIEVPTITHFGLILL